MYCTGFDWAKIVQSQGSKRDVGACAARGKFLRLGAYRPEVSEDLEGILFKGLAKNRKSRYATAGEMLEALSTLMVDEGHRATNNDLAAYLKIVVDAHQGTLPVPCLFH